MKKIILIPLFLLFCLYGYSQVKFGVFVDPQVTWMSPESREVQSQGSTLGINGGLSIDKYFAKNYAISTGLALGQQGGKLEFDYTKVLDVYDDKDSLPPNTALEYKLQYLTVPLGLKLKSNQIGYFTYFVNIGLTNQFNIKAKATSSDGTLNDDSIKKDVFVYNLAYHFGGGVEYGLGQDTALLFGVFYHNGFMDVTNSTPQINSRVIALRLGVLF